MRSYLIRLAFGAALAACVAHPAAAQDQPAAEELNALIYYTLQGDTGSAAAELRRLQGRYPDWTPPSDPASLRAVSPPAAEVNAVYRAIAEKDVPGARTLLDDIGRRHPGWTPPDDLTALIAIEEAQVAFSAAIAAGDLAAASRVVRETPALRRCDRVNNVWLLAALQARSGEGPAALAAYRGVIAACPDFEIAQATLEKAAGLTTEAQLRALFLEAAGRFGDRQAQLEALQARLLAGLGAMPTNPRVPSADGPRPAATAAPSRPRQRVSSVAPAPTRHGQAALEALPNTGDRRLGAVVRAAQNQDWRGCAEASRRPASVDLLYQRAWCVYNLDRPLEALSGFTVAARGSLDAGRTRDAAYGMALSYLKLGATDDAAVVAAAHDLTRTQRIYVEGVILDQRGVRAYEAGRYREAIAFFDALEQLEGSLRRDLAMLRGYAYINLKETGTGLRDIRVLHDAMATGQTHAALNTTYGD